MGKRKDVIIEVPTANLYVKGFAPKIKIGITKSGFRFWWPAFALLILLYLAIILKLPNVQDMAIVALVAVTMMYVIITQGMLGEMRKQRLGVEQLKGAATNIADLLKREGKTKGEVTDLDAVGITTMDILIMAWLSVESSFIAFSLHNPKHAREYKDQFLGTLRDAGLNRLLLDRVEKGLISLTENLEKMKF